MKVVKTPQEKVGMIKAYFEHESCVNPVSMSQSDLHFMLAQIKDVISLDEPVGAEISGGVNEFGQRCYYAGWNAGCKSSDSDPSEDWALSGICKMESQSTERPEYEIRRSAER